jgi:hypothetical protein
LGRGCRQGDPLSPYIFTICVELLSISIKKNRSVKGINIYGIEYCTSQYADDTNFILDGSEESLTQLMFILQEFALCSGLKLNL